MNTLYSDEYQLKLQKLAEDSAIKYQNNDPFPNIYFDDFLPTEAVEAAMNDFPGPKESWWYEFKDEDQVKLANNKVARMPSGVQSVLYFLNSPPMLKFLETLTGIKVSDSRPLLYRRGLTPDQARRFPASPCGFQLAPRHAGGSEDKRADIHEQGLEGRVWRPFRTVGP